MFEAMTVQSTRLVVQLTLYGKGQRGADGQCNGSQIVILHNISLNIGGKVTPFRTKLKPYIILGLRGDYLISYKDFEVQYNGETQTIYGGELDDYNEFVLSGLIGIGLEYNELIK